MFITKKHISRRTVLKGAGVNLALPFLSAMVPASTALAQIAILHMQGWPTQSEPDHAALEARKQRALALGATA